MTSYAGERAKPRTKVKPILRKFTQSEKNSLDLDRPAAEQDGLGLYDSSASWSTHDININSSRGAEFAPGRRGYHARSTSGTSQFSTATGGSGRNGSFVHPFQQTPRPYTPPLNQSYTNLRDYRIGDVPSSVGGDFTPSPAVTEDDDGADGYVADLHTQLRPTYRSTSNLSNYRTNSLTAPTSPITSSIAPQSRLQTKQSYTNTSRLALATSNTSLHQYDDFTSTTPIDRESAMSPSSLRNSLDKGFRTRSRSEASANPRTETIQEARRKWNEKEKAKQEKADQEEVKALQKKQLKEARDRERSHRRSSASDRAGAYGAGAEKGRGKRSRSDLTANNGVIGGSIHEKGEDFVGQDYNSVTQRGQPTPVPFLSDDEGKRGQRVRSTSYTAKQKTHSAWTKFMMWLKTRFLRLSSKKKKKSTPSNTPPRRITR